MPKGSAKPVNNPGVRGAQTMQIYTIFTVVNSTAANRQFLSQVVRLVYDQFTQVVPQLLEGNFMGWGGRLNTSSTGTITKITNI